MPNPTSSIPSIKAPIRKQTPAPPVKLKSPKPTTASTDSATLSNEASSVEPVRGSGGDFGGLLAGLGGGGAESAAAAQARASEENQNRQTQAEPQTAKREWERLAAKLRKIHDRMAQAYKSGDTGEWERLNVESRKLDKPLKSLYKQFNH